MSARMYACACWHLPHSYTKTALPHTHRLRLVRDEPLAPGTRIRIHFYHYLRAFISRSHVRTHQHHPRTDRWRRARVARKYLVLLLRTARTPGSGCHAATIDRTVAAAARSTHAHTHSRTHTHTLVLTCHFTIARAVLKTTQKISLVEYTTENHQLALAKRTNNSTAHTHAHTHNKSATVHCFTRHTRARAHTGT